MAVNRLGDQAGGAQCFAVRDKVVFEIGLTPGLAAEVAQEVVQ